VTASAVTIVVPDAPKAALFVGALTHAGPAPDQLASVSFQWPLAGVVSHVKSAAAEELAIHKPTSSPRFPHVSRKTVFIRTPYFQVRFGAKTILDRKYILALTDPLRKQKKTAPAKV
jgi:hypothetical protein